MQQYLKAALIGGGIGAAVGATYAIFFVAYRNSVAAQADKEPAEVPAVSVPDELPARARIAEAMKERTGKAQEIRARHPDLTWPEALRHAANGTEPESSPEEESHAE